MIQVVQQVLSGNEYPLPQFTLRESPPVVLDIGASVGAAAVYFKLNLPAAEIYCFEPHPRPFAFLEQNVAKFSKVHALPYGLYADSRNVKLYDGKLGSVTNSIVRNQLTGGQGTNVRLLNAAEELARLQIEAVSILKLDTEGCELPILRALQEFRSRIDLIYVEYHSENDRREIDDLLREEFTLFFSNASHIHRGVCGYVSNTVMQATPGAESHRIDQQTT